MEAVTGVADALVSVEARVIGLGLGLGFGFGLGT